MNPDYAKLISDIAENLSRRCSGKLAVYDFEGEPGEYRVAYSVVEIIESAEKLMALAVQLRQPSEIVEDVLSEFKDEIEHMLYHVRDSGVFTDLLVDQGEETN